MVTSTDSWRTNRIPPMSEEPCLQPTGFRLWAMNHVYRRTNRIPPMSNEPCLPKNQPDSAYERWTMSIKEPTGYHLWAKNCVHRRTNRIPPMSNEPCLQPTGFRLWAKNRGYRRTHSYFARTHSDSTETGNELSTVYCNQVVCEYPQQLCPNKRLRTIFTYKTIKHEVFMAIEKSVWNTK